MNAKFSNFRWGLTGEWQEMEVADGRVVSRAGGLPSGAAGTIDLGGRYMLPSFIDAHCHIMPTGFDLGQLHLGRATTHEEVLDLVRQRHTEKPDGWLLAVHYNQTKYEGGAHLTRHDLDKISVTRPILLRHVNGHASVVNTAALAAAGVSNNSPDPAGGSYHRDAAGIIDGLCLEHAHEHVQRAIPKPNVEQAAHAIVAAGKEMAALGIGCASDMMTGCLDLEMELEAYTRAAQMGCPIHMRLYMQWRDVFGGRAVPPDRLRQLIAEADAQPSLRVAGIKIFSDGGISSGTAAIYGRYLTNETSPRKTSADGRDVDGQLIYAPEKLNRMVLTAHEAGWPVSIHAIGDYATDLVLDAFALTGDARRHRLEHAMILSDAQIDRLGSVGCFCTFQPEFLMAIGSAYRKQLGQERAAMLIRSRSVLDAGIRLSFNSDRPIVAGDPWDGILTASNRPDGFDPSENCTREEAILAYTSAGADVNGDTGQMGTLTPGSIAHFQLYDADPITAERPDLDPSLGFSNSWNNIEAVGV